MGRLFYFFFLFRWCLRKHSYFSKIIKVRWGFNQSQGPKIKPLAEKCDKTHNFG